MVRVQHGLPPDPDPIYLSLAPPTSLGDPPASSNRAPIPGPPGAAAASAPPSTGITVRPGVPTSSWSIPPPPRVPGNVGHLSLFNQFMQQQCKSIEWVYADSAGEGTKTTPIWVVRAMVGDECLGRGRGSTKKAARNEAAKEGLVHLGIYVS